MPAPPVAALSSENAAAKSPWPLRGLAFASGMLYAFAHPFAWPGDVDDVMASITRPAWLLALVCLVPLLWAVRNKTPREAYLLSTWMLVPGTFTLLYWLTIAMNVFGGIPLIISCALLLGLSVMGWQMLGMAVAVARHLETRFRWPAACAVPVCWAGMEMWRAYVYFGGFPWGNLGTTQWNNLYLVQLGSLGGVYLIIMLLCCVNVALFELLRFFMKERTFPTSPLVAGVVSLSLAYAYGAYRVGVLDTEASSAPRVKIGLLQGNIEQGIKNKDMQHQDYIIERYARLQRDAIARGAEVVIWPEGALPAYISRNEASMQGTHLPPLEGATGIVGTTVMWRDAPSLTGDACRKSPTPAGCRGQVYLHNSAVVTGPDQRISGRFDKTHLVPFGEYVPWPLGAIARQVVPGIGAYMPGESLTPVAIHVGGAPHKVGGLICYEGVFPQYARGFSAAGAELLVNITNDAWYGVSSAATQHLAFYAMRAAENGRAIARAANTGISTGIDPAGRIFSPTRLYEEAAVVLDFPLMTGRTVYTMTGDVVGIACGAVFFVGLGHALQGWYEARRRKKKTA